MATHKPNTHRTNTQKPKKTKPNDPVREAYEQAEKDIAGDPEFSSGDVTDDLDEGELAQRDNSDEEGLDALERERGTGRPRGRQSGKGSEE